LTIELVASQVSFIDFILESLVLFDFGQITKLNCLVSFIISQGLFISKLNSSFEVSFSCRLATLQTASFSLDLK